MKTLDGMKHDSGKPDLWPLVSAMPRALSAVAGCHSYGADKYEIKNWYQVPEGYRRYSSALLRHLFADSGDQPGRDAESGLYHAAHAAWNALARLELILRDAERAEMEAPDKQAQNADRIHTRI